MDDDFLEIAKRYSLKSGSTLTFALTHNGRLSISNLGDSCALMFSKSGQLKKLSLDQTPAREDEKARIMNNGGFVSMTGDVPRVDGELAVSRAIGDRNIKKFIISEPEVSHQELTENDDLLILSSDGLFRVFDNDSLAEKLRELRHLEGRDISEISQEIILDAC